MKNCTQTQEIVKAKIYWFPVTQLCKWEQEGKTQWKCLQRKTRAFLQDMTLALTHSY